MDILIFLCYLLCFGSIHIARCPEEVLVRTIRYAFFRYFIKVLMKRNAWFVILQWKTNWMETNSIGKYLILVMCTQGDTLSKTNLQIHIIDYDYNMCIFCYRLERIFAHTKRPPDYYALFVNCHIHWILMICMIT